MSDLVKRLRSEVGSFKDMIAMHLEAADEIERLRKRIDTLESKEIDYEVQLDAYEEDMLKRASSHGDGQD